MEETSGDDKGRKEFNETLDRLLRDPVARIEPTKRLGIMAVGDSGNSHVTSSGKEGGSPVHPTLSGKTGGAWPLGPSVASPPMMWWLYLPFFQLPEVDLLPNPACSFR